MIQWIRNILPVYEKETMTSSRTIRLTAIVLGFNLILTLVGLLQLQLMVRDSMYYGEMAYSSLLHMYMLVAVSEAAIILFIVPALTAGSISGERERQTLDLLLCTRLRPVDIVVGKLVSCLSTAFIMMVTSLPILSLVYIYGGLGITDLAQLFFCLAVTTLYIGSVSIFFSALMKRTTVATVLSYLAVIFVVVGTLMLLVLVYHLQVLMGTDGVLAQENMMYPWNLILLINPAMTFYNLLVQQIGTVDSFQILENYGYYIVTEHLTASWWWMASSLLQVGVSVLFIQMASRAVCPLRKR
ncbi:MAG: ABC transporter permease subunit [Lachnospiraceae bacterium]|nr:ABC transporter permease subunit [Lachnospiraceae bacterium]